MGFYGAKARVSVCQVLHFLAQANFSLGAYDTAARLLLERIARNPGTDASRMLLASCYGHLGRAEDARITWAELLKVNPDFSLSQFLIRTNSSLSQLPAMATPLVCR
jgi:tetratricopeptide (TPR) repeat protein